MVIKELISKSVYGTIGYISSKEDLNLLEQYIIYNLPVLKHFKQIISATNYKNYPELIEENNILWKKYFPNSICLNNTINRGHNHGNADLDNILFDYCKENNIEWICKSANDSIINESLLNKEIEDADFYYLNGIGVGGMVNYNFDFNKIINEDFYPQTNFYFLNINKCDYLNNEQYLNETYKYTQLLPEYNGRIWEYIPGWSCEDFLKQCISRNNLSKYHLVSQEKYSILLQTIKEYNIHDCSHKNIMIEGICHFQYPEQQIIEI
jgi:hypothetical protein